MKRALYYIVCLIFPLSGFSQNKLEKKVLAFEDLRFEAMMNKDTQTLSAYLSEDLRYTHSNGLVETKADHLKNISSGKIVYKQISPLEQNIRLYGRKTAVINGVVEVDGELGGKSFLINLRYTDIYVRKKGKWKLAAWQSLKVD